VELSFTLTNCILLSTSWPVNVTDVGSGSNTNYKNIIAGFGEPLQVVDGMATVATFGVLYNQADVGTMAYLVMAPADPASNPGFMACLDTGNPGDIISLTPPFENFDYHVFVINGVVAEEESTMDSVKAMYR
jgi:hypothetical protein